MSTAKEKELDTREIMTRVIKRLAAVSVVSASASLAMAVAVVAMLPLKERIPYVVEVSAITGEVSLPKQAEVGKYVPSDEVKKFFVKRWISDAFTINQYTTVSELDPRARKMLRGANVISAYDDQMAKDGKFKLLAAYPGIVRDVMIDSITPVAGTPNAMVANVTMTTRISGRVETKKRMVTVYFDQFPIKDPAEADVSPVGMFITDFKVSDA